MADVTDTLRGIYHFLTIRVPDSIPLVPPKPRTVNRWQKDGKAIVAKAAAGENPRQSIGKVLSLLGSLDRTISRGERVLVKPNFNSADPFPATTDLSFLRIVVEILMEAGARVTIGESSGAVFQPTRKVLHKLGVFDMAKSLDVEVVIFEEKPQVWVRVEVNGKYLKTLTMPRIAYEADRLVYLPCMKTHFLAAYSGALKLPFGFSHPGERRSFHFNHLREKLAEVNLCWQPDLIIMDVRKAFVTGGPTSGKTVEPGLIFASGDPVAIDVEGVKVLLAYGAEKIPADPWQLPQLSLALQHNLGAAEDGYIVLQ